MSEPENQNLILNSKKNSIQQIEFLPVWYQESSQRKRSYLTQYVLLAVMFAMILVLDSLYTGFISDAKGEIAENKDNIIRAKACSSEYENLKKEIDKLEKYTAILEQVDSRINIPKVLAELSFLAAGDIVFSELECTAEGFPSLKKDKNNSSNTLRTSASSSGDGNLAKAVRFKISINGIAPDAEKTASFVSRLEDSPYFRGVSLLFSRNDILNLSNSRQENKKKMVSKFRINCHLANYRKVTSQD